MGWVVEGRAVAALGAALAACGPADQPRSGAVGDGEVDVVSDIHAFPPPWLGEEAARFTVPADAGWAWAIDPDWSLPGFAVPSVYSHPGGGLAMMLTRATPHDEGEGRALCTSSDGLSWGPVETLLMPGAFGGACGTRLEDSAFYDAGPEGQHYVFDATLSSGGASNVREGRQLCLAEAAALPADPPVPHAVPSYFEGCEAGDTLSVPGLLPFVGHARVWFNGTCGDEQLGLRAVDLQLGAHGAEVAQPEAMFGPGTVDPNPVWRRGGGVDLFLTLRDDDAQVTGIGRVPLDDEALWPTEAPTPLFWGEGPCLKREEQSGPCFIDPTFVHLPDGRLALYFGELIEGPSGIESRVLRAFATDHDAHD